MLLCTQGLDNNRNKRLLCAVLTFACAQFIFGILFMAEGISTNNMTMMFNSWYCPLNSVSSAICDAIITISICIYLRPFRSSPFRKVDFIHHLHFIFVQMGTITCVTALTMYSQIRTSGTYLTTGPAGVLSKTYTNSMLAVLNARKTFRDRERANLSVLELPTIPTIR
ncbi:hypothetical protein V8B97DRAFT_423690 [Scleroderma yunnanense]